MLVLTRKKGERIMIDPAITITVLGIHSDHVALGIEAPADVNIGREEVYKTVSDRPSVVSTKGAE